MPRQKADAASVEKEAIKHPGATAGKIREEEAAAEASTRRRAVY